MGVYTMEVNKNKDTKRQRFIRIGERRVNKILDDLESLGKCSNKRNYQYSDEDVKKIFKAVEDKMKSIRGLFSDLEKKKDHFSLE
jgi:hypothetical protein